MNDAVEKRLSEKGEIPKWAEDFPVETKSEARIARRDFIRYLSLVSLGLFVGQGGVLFKKWWSKKESLTPAFRIVGLNDLEVGGSYVFNLPEKHEPILLIRLAQEEYVAYSQKCTHLQCPVIWRREDSKILCPCHHGAFQVQTGEVLYGPPERPLPKAKLSLKSDGVYFEGFVENSGKKEA